jgi:hypothetical protein
LSESHDIVDKKWRRYRKNKMKSIRISLNWIETKEISKIQVNEIKKASQNVNELLNKDIESIRKRNQTDALEIKSSLKVKLKKPLF